MIRRCFSRISNDSLEDWAVRTGFFQTPEERESRCSVCWNQDSAQMWILEPRTKRPIIMEGGIVPILTLAHFLVPTANHPNPTLGSETSGRGKRL
jgi:hypothetical protein